MGRRCSDPYPWTRSSRKNLGESMALDTSIKQQLTQYLGMLEKDVIIRLDADSSANGQKVREFITEIASMTNKISIEETTLELSPGFTIDPIDQSSGIAFAGVPLGHEFTSFVLALLQVGGRAPVITDEQKKRIQSITTPHHFKTFVSLTCQNCPDVVQALNIMSVLNPHISHTMIEGGMFQDLVEKHDIRAVPTVFDGHDEFTAGRKTLDDLINLIAGPLDASDLGSIDPFDLLVIGAGPAGATAAIYAARKGIRTGIVAERFGGQVMDTMGIENYIGTPYVEGPHLMGQMREHLNQYDIDIIEGQRVKTIDSGNGVSVTLENGAELFAKTVVIATGARWRLLGIPGESEFKNKGVSYCPHCDGPLYEGKDVVVIGGGNSGVEAAIDLSYVAKSVTVLEFLDELKADEVLQKRLHERENMSVITQANTTAITGVSGVTGVDYTDRATGEEHHLDAAGVFPLIGLVPNTEFLDGTIAMNERGEIIVDNKGATNLPGVYAAGDCTTSAFKQIVISVGSGATAALGAFDYMMRQG